MTALQVAGYLLLAVLQALAYAVRGLGAALLYTGDRALNQRKPAQRRPAQRRGPARRTPARSQRRPRRQRGAWTTQVVGFGSLCAAATVQGWRAGWQAGRERNDELAKRRAARAAKTPGPQPAAPKTARPAARPAPPPAAPQTPAAQQGATVTPIRKAPPPMTTQTTTRPGAGEASGYESTLAALDALLKAAQEMKGTGEQITGSLSAEISSDAETLGDVMAIDDAFDAVVSAVEKAKATFIRRHGDIHEAVNANPQAAGNTTFYRN